MILPEIDNYHWAEVFEYARYPILVITDPSNQSTPYSRACNGFTPQDVENIWAIRNGAPDEGEWVGVFELWKGDFAILSAHCDFSGWDCCASGYSYVADSLDDLMRWGMNQDQRQMLAEQAAVDISHIT